MIFLGLYPIESCRLCCLSDFYWEQFVRPSVIYPDNRVKQEFGTSAPLIVSHQHTHGISLKISSPLSAANIVTQMRELWHDRV